MHAVFTTYLERLQRLESGATTLTNMARTAALFAESGIDLETAEDWQVEEWLASLPLAPRTRKLHYENLRAACRYAVRRGLLERAPTDGVRLPRQADTEPRVLDGSELRALLRNVATGAQELLLLTLMYTGMRRSEVRGLRWEDVSETSLRVVGKGGKLRYVPLHPTLAAALDGAERDGEYVFPGRAGAISDAGVGYMLAQVKGDVDVRFHDFRRTVATSLAENEVRESVIDSILGWAPRTVGSRYYIRTSDRRAQAAILQLYADDPINE